MMLLPLIAGLILYHQPLQQPRTIFQQVVELPDPNNGYEDYVRAADILRSGQGGIYLGWTPKQFENMIEPAKADANYQYSEASRSQLALAKDLQSLDYLGVQRLAAQRFASVVALVKAGNAKRVWNPRQKVDVATSFPELAEFKSVAKFLRTDAYVRFADGDSKGGTDSLLDGCTFARRIRGISLSSELVGLACQAIMLDGFEENLSKLSQKDALRIMRYIDSAIAEPSSYGAALTSERDFMIGSIDQFWKTPESVTLWSDDDPRGAAITKVIKGMSAGDSQVLKESLTRALDEQYRALIARANQPESAWNLNRSAGLPPNPTLIVTVPEVVDAMVNMVMPVQDQTATAELRSRAQLRILGVHARIIDFRWRNNRLPVDLKEAMPEKYTVDPMAQSAFQYELREGGYRLYSKGNADTGPIELRYRRQAGTAPNNNDPIPPKG